MFSLMLTILLLNNWNKGTLFKPSLTNQDTSRRLEQKGAFWIPPTLSSENNWSTCTGCCLIPTIGGLIARETFKKETELESVARMPKFSLGINYSLGVAYAGALSKSTDEIIDFGRRNYWNNILEIDTRYYFNPNWALCIGGGYMWTYLEGRLSYLNVPVKPQEEPWGSAGDGEWSIWSMLIFAGYEYNMIRKPKSVGASVRGGIEYYRSEGICITWMGRYNHQTGESELREVSGKSFNRGVGVTSSVGIEKPILHNLTWNLSFVLRAGMAFTHKQKTEEKDVVWEKPIRFNFTGYYIRMGINYNFFGKGGEK